MAWLSPTKHSLSPRMLSVQILLMRILPELKERDFNCSPGPLQARIRTYSAFYEEWLRHRDVTVTCDVLNRGTLMTSSPPGGVLQRRETWSHDVIRNHRFWFKSPHSFTLLCSQSSHRQKNEQTTRVELLSICAASGPQYTYLRPTAIFSLCGTVYQFEIKQYPTPC